MNNMSVPGKQTSYVIGCSFVAALGGLLFGFDTAVISGTLADLKSVFMLSNASLGFTVAIALVGTIVGAIVFGKPSDIYGRRFVLFVLAICYLISALGSALAWGWYSFLFFRFLGGLAVGGASVVSPMYIAEIAPAKMRGRLVALTQFNIVLGILLAFLSNYGIAIFDMSVTNWRWMFAVEAIPSFLFFLLLFKVPRSPRWLIAKQRVDEAYVVLSKLCKDEHEIQHEMNAVKASLDVKHHSAKEPFFEREYAIPIFLAIAIASFNQLSGINAILYYAPSIFEMAGAGQDTALLQSVAVGVVNLIFTMLAMLVIDLIGRRSLMLIGSVGYLISLSAIAASFYYYNQMFTRTGGLIVLVSIFLFIAAHAFGQGAVIWVFISEIFPNRIRARGQALGSFTHWFMAALISWIFPVIAAQSGGSAFAFFAVMMFLQLLWVIFIMPETKGIPLEQIQKKLHIK
ncbi:D-xylose-proton symporter [Poriferisphaera corsica]|uniref:D-xylose-proton symporter n=1 Tax=Poriferisphaera corsica TaxID=2528020 RepID=A0A517YQ55_9BACT|nr:sugar porter family MFS transporter [Poriferisphaera corsica]QDU32350.1 D-xylose-proton symporter [Poriferisphaera corsica]